MQFLAASGITDLLRGLCGWLCDFIYWIIAWLYELFVNISRVEILTSADIKPIYERVTMVLTIVMAFYVTFEAVKYVIQPETFTDKEKGGTKLVIRMVLVVVLIAFVPTIFSLAYKFQNTVFDNQLFSKVILGKQNVDSAKFGRVFSANILGMFYYADEENWEQHDLETANNCDKIPCKNAVNINLNSLVEYGELPLMQVGLTSKGSKKIDETGRKIEMYYIKFDGILAVGVGAFIAYMLLLYCVDAGVRVAQLAFLQIISPIAIIGYLSPKKDGIFQKWMKQCFTTYLDLFLRLGIIYFVLLVCQILSDAYSSGTLVNNVAGDTSTMKMFIYIALVMGLLLFAKKAPKMLEELFPKMGAASGNFGLKPGERVAPLAARAAGAAIGAGLVGAKGIIGATANQAKRNWRNIRSGKTKEDRQNLSNARTNRFEKFANRASAGWNRLRSIGGTKADREAAKKAYIEAKQQHRDAKIDHQSAFAARQNSRFRFGAPVTGAVGGIVRGAYNGGQATDLKSIGKQVTQGMKKESEALGKTEKWYNEGGGSNIDRIMTSVEKGLGISTEADRIAEEIKYEDEKIKANDSLIAIEGDVKKKSDEVESRLESKLDTDLKTKVDATSESYLRNKIPTIDIKSGETLAELRKRYKAKSETASAALEEAVRNHGKDSAQAKAAEKDLAIAQAEEQLVKKHTMRAAYTHMLQHPSSTDDVPTLQRIEAMKESVNTARRSTNTVREFTRLVEEEVKAGTLTRADADSQLAAFNGTADFTSYDQLDGVIVRLQKMVSDKNIDNQRIKETKRKLETSDANAAAKADSSSAGK